ncbi:hypothetical protein GCM10027174_44680 [Salinifilum aidingensis]
MATPWRMNPDELEHRMGRIYDQAYKDWDKARDGSDEWHVAAQTMALVAQTAMQAQAMQSKR